MREQFHRIWNKFTSLKSNLEVLEDWMSDIATLGNGCCQLLERPDMAESVPTNPDLAALAAKMKSLDLKFILEDLPALVRESVSCLDILHQEMMSLQRRIEAEALPSPASGTAEVAKS